MSVADFLATVEGFRSIPHQQLESIAEATEPATFAEGECLMRAGDPGETMHVIVSGRVRIPIVDEQGRETLFRLGPGDLVGEMALLSGDPRRADVIAEEPVETLVFHRVTVEALLDSHPALAAFLSEILGHRLDQSGGIERMGKYRLLEKLGAGATGRVYRALHPELRRTVAVKILSHSLVYQTRFRERFLEEARTVAGLAHPNIVQVFDVGSAYATWYIVMEEVQGTDLARRLASGGPVEPERARRLLSQVGAALAYAHSQGFAHRDVKPANIAVDDRGRVKLMDFGLARPFLEDEENGEKRQIDGTPMYIAPETARGHTTDGRVDIYALGVIAFEMLAGRHPFEAETPIEMMRAHVKATPPPLAELAPSTPADLLELVEGMMVKDPDERLSDWDWILAVLGGGLPSGSADSHETIVRIRYEESSASAVEVAVQGLFTDLSGVPGIDLRRGTLMANTVDTAGDDE